MFMSLPFCKYWSYLQTVDRMVQPVSSVGPIGTLLRWCFSCRCCTRGNKLSKIVPWHNPIISGGQRCFDGRRASCFRMQRPLPTPCWTPPAAPRPWTMHPKAEQSAGQGASTPTVDHQEPPCRWPSNDHLTWARCGRPIDPHTSHHTCPRLPVDRGDQQ